MRRPTLQISPGRWFAHFTTLAPGLVDTGCASAAGFISSLYAARILAPDVLGAYAVYFSAVFVIGRLLDQLLFLPSRLSTLALPRGSRVAILSWSVPSGLVLGLVFGSLVLFAGLPIWGQVSFDTLVGLAVTAALLATFSPLQDHLRRTLHLSGQSWMAAMVSTAQLFIAASVAFALHTHSVPPEWIPFGALAIANGASLLFGLALVSKAITGSHCPRPPLRAVLRTGRTFLLAESMPAFAGFLAPVLIATLASAEVLGFAEAARVVAQPILVVALGLSTIVGPRLMEAGANGSNEYTKRALRGYSTVMVLFALAYLSVVGWSYSWNPMQALLPRAYVLPGLVAIQIIATISQTLSQAPASVLYGAKRNRGIVSLRALSAVVIAATTAVLAAWTQAYTLPLAYLAAALAVGMFGLYQVTLLSRAHNEYPDLSPSPVGPSVRQP